LSSCWSSDRWLEPSSLTDPESVPDLRQAGGLKAVDRLPTEPPLEGVGHRPEHRVGGLGHRRGAGQLRPEPRLDLKIAAGKAQQILPVRKAEVVGLHAAAAVTVQEMRMKGIIKRETAGSAGGRHGVHDGDFHGANVLFASREGRRSETMRQARGPVT
jgi:hypothetical protein